MSPAAKASTQKVTVQKTPVPKASTEKPTIQKTSAKAIQAKAPAQKPAPKKKPPAKTAAKPAEPEVSQAVTDLVTWIIAAGDNRDLPFAVVDKTSAQVLLFSSGGTALGKTPALLGSAIGDDSAPGVGDRELREIPAEERTTPAGRFLAAYGPAAGHKSVLWVDYATSISIHPVLTTPAARKEKRKERLASAAPDDNRITHGCINVASTFYDKFVRPTFKKGGVFYVLPDSMSVQEAFPAFGTIPPPAPPAQDQYAEAEHDQFVED